MVDWHEMTFSQAALTTYERCPRQFRYRYVDQIAWPSWVGLPEGQQGALEQGQLFHLLARRYYSGLPVGDFTSHPHAAQLQTWLTSLQEFLPYDEVQTFFPECELRLNRPGLRLMARYDLLVVSPDGTATIYDWKTQRPPQTGKDDHGWQTQVYRYLLVEAGQCYQPGGFRPEQVRMAYFYPLAPARPTLITYSALQHRLSGRDLEIRMAEIRATPPDGFAQTADSSLCARCAYQAFCHGRNGAP